MSSRFVLRVRLLTAALLFMSLAIIAKLYFLQVVHGDEYDRRASAQLVSTRNPLLNRGAIYFTDKDGAPILAATLREVEAYNNDDEQKGRYGLERYYEPVLGRSRYTN